MEYSKLLLIVLVTLLGLAGWQRLQGDALVRAQAENVACEGVVCEATLQKSKQTLFGWEMTYQTSSDTARVVEVACTRELWIFGAYDCHVHTSNSR